MWRRPDRPTNLGMKGSERKHEPRVETAVFDCTVPAHIAARVGDHLRAVMSVVRRAVRMTVDPQRRRLEERLGQVRVKARVESAAHVLRIHAQLAWRVVGDDDGGQLARRVQACIKPVPAERVFAPRVVRG